MKPEVTYDSKTRAVYIKLAEGKIDKTLVLENNSVYYADIDDNGLLLGYELLIPPFPKEARTK